MRFGNICCCGEVALHCDRLNREAEKSVDLAQENGIVCNDHIPIILLPISQRRVDLPYSVKIQIIVLPAEKCPFVLSGIGTTFKLFKSALKINEIGSGDGWQRR